MKIKSIFFTLAIAVVGMWGCYPGSVTVSELDTVLTIYDDQEDFARFKTFHLPDTIIPIGEDGKEYESKYDEQILDRVLANLLTLKYKPVSTIDSADIVVLLAKSKSELLVGWNPCPGCWCGYWCWYPGWGWGGYNPYYPGGGIVYSYPIGTIFINMFDNTSTEDMNVMAPWVGSFNGLISGSDSQILARVDNAIDQAFEQSPYLGTN